MSKFIFSKYEFWNSEKRNKHRNGSRCVEMKDPYNISTSVIKSYTVYAKNIIICIQIFRVVVVLFIC